MWIKLHTYQEDVSVENTIEYMVDFFLVNGEKETKVGNAEIIIIDFSDTEKDINDIRYSIENFGLSPFSCISSVRVYHNEILYNLSSEESLESDNFNLEFFNEENEGYYEANREEIISVYNKVSIISKFTIDKNLRNKGLGELVFLELLRYLKVNEKCEFALLEADPYEVDFTFLRKREESKQRLINFYKGFNFVLCPSEEGDSIMCCYLENHQSI